MSAIIWLHFNGIREHDHLIEDHYITSKETRHLLQKTYTL